jgi:hypothetical protein
MGSVVFVHGTGVRQPSYDNIYGVIEEQIKKILPLYRVHRCYWGDREGSKLLSGGASIPEYDTARSLDPGAENLEIAAWRILYEDPDAEWLSLIGGISAPKAFLPSEESSLEVITEVLLRETSLTRRIESEIGVEAVWEKAKLELTTSLRSAAAVKAIPEVNAGFLSATARSLVAHAITMTYETPGNNEMWPTGEQRDELVEALTQAWGGGERSVVGWLGNRVRRLAFKIGTDRVARKRGAISDEASPAAGDVLLYQARGEGIRDFIDKVIIEIPKPIVLLTHSLGGIACFDLLVGKQIEGIAMLITVGSQVPLLYELDALNSLRHGSPLPGWFPRWLNIYDKRDFLSYIGGGIFGTDVSDVLVDNGQPFPQSHSAYWRNFTVWDAIKQNVR